MRSFEYDLHYIQAGIEVLVGYLLSSDTFWPIDVRAAKGEPGYPQLTLGGLLLSRARLAAYPKTPLQAGQAEQVFSDMDHIRSQWRVAWEKKASHNFGIRLRMWRDFIEEYRQDPLDNADRYSYEVRLRAMLTLLKREGGGQLPAELELLTLLDKHLKAALVIDDFIWEQELQSGFPEKIYWYLYGKLPAMPMKE